MINHLKLHFVTEQISQDTVIAAQYDGPLVIVSILIAIFASYVSFLLAARINSSQLKNEGEFWTFFAALFLGAGIWAMHFIGMLAYKLAIPVSYDLTITVLSILPSVFASYIVISPTLGRFKNLLFRSVLMGAGIGCMHFFGMMAMIMPAHMAYDPSLFILSIVVAIVLSGTALKINDLRKSSSLKPIQVNLLSAVTMGLAISGMHYIGMISMYVFATPTTQFIEIADNDNSTLVQLVIGVLFLLSLILIGTMELRARSLLSAKLEAVLNTVQDAVISFDSNGVIEFANPSTMTMFNYQQQALIGNNITQLLPDALTEIDHLNNPVNQGKSRLLTGLRQDQKAFPVTMSVKPISKSTSGHYVATIKDLTDIQNQEAFTQTIFDTLPITLIVKEAQSLTFSHINKAGESLLGKRKQALIGLSDFDIFPANEAALFTVADRNALNQDDVLLVDEQAVTINGETRYLRTRKVAIKDNLGEAKYLLAVCEDVSELRAAKAELVSLHQRMAIAADAAHIGVWEWNFKTNKLIWDDWMHILYGIDKESFSGDYHAWANSIHADDYDCVTSSLMQAVANHQEFHAEFQITLPDGQSRYLNADGRIFGDSMIGINFDISKRVIAEQKLLQLAQTDHLTQLANRNALAKFTQHELKRTERTDSIVACIYLDLDKFKPINDTYGHHIGDAVLIEVAKRLNSTARKTDCVARIGGDEFVIILTNIVSFDQAKSALTRFIQAITAPIASEVGKLVVEVSAGLALYPEHGNNLDELLSHADKQMYLNKKDKPANIATKNKSA